MTTSNVSDWLTYIHTGWYGHVIFRAEPQPTLRTTAPWVNLANKNVKWKNIFMHYQIQLIHLPSATKHHRVAGPTDNSRDIDCKKGIDKTGLDGAVVVTVA